MNEGNPTGIMKFRRMAKELRQAAGLKHAEAAAGLGLKTKSYSNLEATNRKVIAIDRVRRMARMYSLDQERTAELIAAWEELPVSEYSEDKRAGWSEARRAKRATVQVREFRAALVEIISLMVADSPKPEDLCACVIGEKCCELCNALILLGLSGYEGSEKTIAALAAMSEELSKPESK